jgi:hypothetical protein
MIGARFTALAFALAATFPAVAFAEEPSDDEYEAAVEPAEPAVVMPIGDPVEELTPAEEADIDKRLAFLEERIATQHLHAKIWWGGWLSFYSVGTAVQTARAIMEDDRAQQADFIVSVVKSTGGVIRYLVDPMKGIQGLEDFPGESKEARLARAERILEENAENTTPFGPWYAHIINAAINGAGAVVVGVGFDDWKTGLISAGVGTAVGEISLFTQPWEADSDLEEYKTKFGERKATARRPPVNLSVVPSAGGGSLKATF